MEKAREVYYSIVDMLDEKGWRFERFDEDLVIRSGIKGEDLPIEFFMFVKQKNQLVQFISEIPITVPDDKRIDIAIAVAVVNNGLIDGSFDFDISSGKIRFRLTSSYRDSYLGADVFEYMILCASSTVDEYNEKFFMLSKGMMTLQEFMEQE